MELNRPTAAVHRHIDSELPSADFELNSPFDDDCADHRQLVRRYLEYNERLGILNAELADFRRQRGQDFDQRARFDFDERFRELRERTTHTTIELVRALNRLDENEQLQLVDPDDSYYDHLERPQQQLDRHAADTALIRRHKLDDMCARDALYRYILEPSPVVTAAHRRHQQRLLATLKPGN